MSRKGNKLINIAQDVNINIQPNQVLVEGKLGKLAVDYPANLIKVEKIDQHLKVSRFNDEKQTKMYHGTVNSLLSNAIIGVSQGFSKKLKIVGVGYKASVVNNQLVLAIGFSHPVKFDIPQGLKVSCPSQVEINIDGYDKIVVGEFAANVRAVRKPEPYKGKGIMYVDEHIIRKVGKTAEGAKK